MTEQEAKFHTYKLETVKDTFEWAVATARFSARAENIAKAHGLEKVFAHVAQVWSGRGAMGGAKDALSAYIWEELAPIYEPKLDGKL
jgi:hypothetical protein